MHSRSDAPSSIPNHFILNCFFSLNIEDTLTFMKKFHIRKVKCLVRGGCQFGGWNQVTTLLTKVIFIQFALVNLWQKFSCFCSCRG